MNAVILARVSSQEQEAGHSIKAQIDRLTEYCRRTGLPVTRTFTLVESSTRGDRKEFHEMIDYLKAQAKPVALVADAVDRVQRGFKESVVLDELRHQGVEVHFVREGIVLNDETPSEQLLLWDFSTVAAKAYVTALSANVRRSFAWKVDHGEWPNRAPVGYRNVPDPVAPGKRAIIVDEERAHYIRRAFERYSTGAYSIAGLAALLKREGLTNSVPPHRPLGGSSLYRILKDPFYYGEMRIKGKIRPHRYPPLISRQLFDVCQAKRDRFHKRPFKYQAKPFLFRGILHCAHCGCAVSTDLKKGRYAYLCCTKRRGPCGGHRIREEVAVDQVRGLLRGLHIPPRTLERIQAALLRQQAEECRFNDESVSGLQARHREIQEQLDALLNLRLRNVITDEDYERKSRELHDLQREVEVRIQEHTDGDEQFGITASTLLDLAARAADLFESSNIDEKRALLSFVCSNLELHGEKLLYKLKSPFDTVLSAHGRSAWLPLVHAFRTDLRRAILAMTHEMALARAILLGGKLQGEKSS